MHYLEPQPLIYQCLSKTIKQKNITNVNLFNIGLSNKEEDSFIHTNNDGDASLDGIRDEKFNQMFPCHLKKLDSYKFNKLDFIKIDVECSEWDVLEGATKTITLHRPTIILETFKNKNNKRKLEQFCSIFSYTSKYISADNYLLQPQALN